ncbi:MAG: DUF1587 domain-containing protein, partial [Planctomycetales bacterium]
ALAGNPTTHFRRLTRREYERTMQDLLGLEIGFGSRLPEDGRTIEGFRNNGEMLRMSPLQYEMYLQIADEALAKAIVSGLRGDQGVSSSGAASHSRRVVWASARSGEPSCW